MSQALKARPTAEQGDHLVGHLGHGREHIRHPEHRGDSSVEELLAFRFSNVHLNMGKGLMIPRDTA